jgi:hypothetical protein
MEEVTISTLVMPPLSAVMLRLARRLVSLLQGGLAVLGVKLLLLLPRLTKPLKLVKFSICRIRYLID